MKYRLRDINRKEDIPAVHRSSPAGLLLEYHNLERPYDRYSKPALIIGTCIDFRVNLRYPENFAFCIRAGGANMHDNEFFLSASMALGSIRHFAIIGHSDCAMVNLTGRRQQIEEGLEAFGGMDAQEAGPFLERSLEKYEIVHEIEFLIKETVRLSSMFPGLEIVPMYFRVEDVSLCLVEKDEP